jgi:hypothetical protein
MKVNLLQSRLGWKIILNPLGLAGLGGNYIGDRHLGAEIFRTDLENL